MFLSAYNSVVRWGKGMRIGFTRVTKRRKINGVCLYVEKGYEKGQPSLHLLFVHHFRRSRRPWRQPSNLFEFDTNPFGGPANKGSSKLALYARSTAPLFPAINRNPWQDRPNVVYRAGQRIWNCFWCFSWRTTYFHWFDVISIVHPFCTSSIEFLRKLCTTWRL